MTPCKHCPAFAAISTTETKIACPLFRANPLLHLQRFLADSSPDSQKIPNGSKKPHRAAKGLRVPKSIPPSHFVYSSPSGNVHHRAVEVGVHLSLDHREGAVVF